MEEPRPVLSSAVLEKQHSGLRSSGAPRYRSYIDVMVQCVSKKKSVLAHWTHPIKDPPPEGLDRMHVQTFISFSLAPSPSIGAASNFRKNLFISANSSHWLHNIKSFFVDLASFKHICSCNRMESQGTKNICTWTLFLGCYSSFNLGLSSFFYVFPFKNTVRLWGVLFPAAEVEAIFLPAYF